MTGSKKAVFLSYASQDAEAARHIVAALRSAGSQRALEKLLEMGDLSLGYQIADVYAWRRENDKAFEWLERAYQRHDGGLGYVTYDRYLVNLRSDPRYTALLRKLKLSE